MGNIKIVSKTQADDSNDRHKRSEKPATFDIQRTGATNTNFFYVEDCSNFFIRNIVAFFIKIHVVIPKIIIFKSISFDNIWVYNHKCLILCKSCYDPYRYTQPFFSNSVHFVSFM